MAKIYGVQLKSIKVWNGMEDQGMEANLYMDNHKIGSVYYGGDGGPMNIYVDNKEDKEEFKERVNRYFKKFPIDTTGYDAKDYNGQKAEEWIKFLMTPEAFVDELCNLNMNEKAFKKYTKEGYKLLLVCDYPIFASGNPYIQPMVFGGSDPLKSVTTFIRKKKEAHPLLKCKVYGALDDFVIEGI